MKRFTNLLKKEIKELVTKQLIISLAFTVLLWNFIGQMSKKEVQKAIGVQTISALDQDGSASSQALLKGLESARFKILDQSGKTKEQALETARTGESKLLLVIPKGFGDSLTELKPSEIETYSFMRSFSLIGARGQVVVQGVISALNEALSNNFLKERLPDFDPQSLKRPIKSRDFVVVQDKMAEGSANMVAGLISQPGHGQIHFVSGLRIELRKRGKLRAVDLDADAAQPSQLANQQQGLVGLLQHLAVRRE
ncbi:MAG: ABC transporter permease, partial [Candidatus Aminicenantes bacterium]|nr:ABC transporter permease [Candidatus Aminicenantes bacterium]